MRKGFVSNNPDIAPRLYWSLQFEGGFNSLIVHEYAQTHFLQSTLLTQLWHHKPYSRKSQWDSKLPGTSGALSSDEALGCTSSCSLPEESACIALAPPVPSVAALQICLPWSKVTWYLKFTATEDHYKNHVASHSWHGGSWDLAARRQRSGLRLNALCPNTTIHVCRLLPTLGTRRSLTSPAGEEMHSCNALAFALRWRILPCCVSEGGSCPLPLHKKPMSDFRNYMR